MRILAVDSSLASSGWALLDTLCHPLPPGLLYPATLLDAGEVKQSYSGAKGYLHMARKVADLLLQIERDLLSTDHAHPTIDLLVCEKQFVMPQMRGDVGIVLGTSAGIWMGLAVARLAPSLILVVPPMEWGASFHLPKGRDCRKQIAQRIANDFAPNRELGEDSADALLIGLWAAMRFPNLEAAQGWQQAPTAATRAKRAKKPQIPLFGKE